MGASRFVTRHKGKTIQAAYQAAVADAEFEHGHEQGYSGAINSTHGYVDYTKRFKESKQPLSNYINFILDNASKGDCYAICLKEPVVNNNKVKSKVEHIVTPGTKKWVLKYAVWNLDDKLKDFSTKGEAVKFARNWVEKTGGTVGIYMEKVLEQGSSCVAMVTYKKSTKEEPGDWVFFGLAPD